MVGSCSCSSSRLSGKQGSSSSEVKSRWRCGQQLGCPSVELKDYKLITKSYAVERDYEGESIFCFCNLKSPRWCSWSQSNPGRRFYGCQRFPGRLSCGFHLWHDEEFPARAVEVINELKKREAVLHQHSITTGRAVDGANGNLFMELENERLKIELERMRINLDRMCTGQRAAKLKLVFAAMILIAVGVIIGSWM